MTNLNREKKSQYHSALVGAGPIKVKVRSGIRESKFRSKGESGHLYVNLEHDGYGFAFSAENEASAQAFAGYEGKEITIKAEGRGEDARIKVLDADETAPPVPQKQARNFHVEMMRIQNAIYYIKEAVQAQNDQSKINGIETTDAQKQAECSTTFIQLGKMGLIDSLSSTPAWSARGEEKPKEEESDTTQW